MSDDHYRPNGRQKRAIEGLAAALQECFDAATEKATEAAQKAQQAAGKAQQAAEKAQQAAGKAQRAAEEAKDVAQGLSVRLDRQDDTLRMIWTQCGGRKDARLPIDRE